jgi:hypothetical protein
LIATQAGAMSREVATVIATYAAVLLLILLVAKIAVMLRARRRRQDALALAHCRSMIMETLVVRARVSGQIDAATYQERMKDIVSSGRS